VHGQTIAAMAAVVLAKSINDDQLVRALETRTHIGQATGILMERYDLDAERAFEVLRRISSQTNTKLRDLAVEIVTTRRLPAVGDAAEDELQDANQD
jgi:AmiR/NasT family two-component response regulator